MPPIRFIPFDKYTFLWIPLHLFSLNQTYILLKYIVQELFDLSYLFSQRKTVFRHNSLFLLFFSLFYIADIEFAGCEKGMEIIMEQLKKHLKDTYHLSSYQIAQIFFLFKTIASEISKILIMGFLFHNQLSLYLFALLILLFLRSAMGGLHFYTYVGCLSASTFYLWLAVYILPQIALAKYLQLAALLLCILLCNRIGPIISKYRPDVCKERFEQCKKFITRFLFLYALILYIIPENKYLSVGFWVIILHSLQLAVAKIQKKGEHTK